MTEEQIKEAVSKQFVRILANSHGFKTLSADPDHGVDLTVVPVTTRNTPAGIRYLDSQSKLDFQLKATTPATVVDAEDFLRYDLEAKTYNDLVFRRGDYYPLFLVLVVLDDTPPNCISIDDERLAVAGRAYWFLPPEGAAETQNVATIRISIPKANRLDLNFVRSCYDLLDIAL